jgi:hypothetical protein
MFFVPCFGARAYTPDGMKFQPLIPDLRSATVAFTRSGSYLNQEAH